MRERLDDQDRLDIIHQIAVWNTDLTEEELRDDIDDVRTWVNRSRDYGKAVTLALVIVVSFIMAMVEFPSLTNGLRWTGRLNSFIMMSDTDKVSRCESSHQRYLVPGGWLRSQESPGWPSND